MERNAKEKLYERLAVALGEPLEMVWRMVEQERNHLITVMLGETPETVAEEPDLGNLKAVREGGEVMVVGSVERREASVGDEAVAASVIWEPQEACNVDKISQEVKDVNIDINRQLLEDIGEVKRLLQGSANEGLGDDEIQAYLEAHMDTEGRVKVRVQEIAASWQAACQADFPVQAGLGDWEVQFLL